MDAKDEFFSKIYFDMQKILDINQIEELKSCLYLHSKDLKIERVITEITPYTGGNEEFIKKFYIAKHVEGCSEKTLRYYIATLKFFMKVIRKPITKIKTEDIQIYLAWYRKERNCSKCNMNNIRRILSTFFHWARDNDIITKSPVDAIKKIKCESKIRVPFTLEEIEKIRNATKNDIKLRAIIEFLLSTACRVSEVVTLKRSEVNFEEGIAIVMGKGSKERAVYLNTQAKFYLKQYLDARIDNNPYLFVSSLYPFKTLAVSGIEIAIRKLGRRLHIEAHPHKFRHTAATWMLRKGMHVELVQQVLGHKKIDTTMIYAKVDQIDVKYAHNKFSV